MIIITKSTMYITLSFQNTQYILFDYVTSYDEPLSE